MVSGERDEGGGRSPAASASAYSLAHNSEQQFSLYSPVYFVDAGFHHSRQVEHTGTTVANPEDNITSCREPVEN